MFNRHQSCSDIISISWANLATKWRKFSMQYASFLEKSQRVTWHTTDWYRHICDLWYGHKRPRCGRIAPDVWGISSEIALMWMPMNLTDDKSPLVQVMEWCHQETRHYLSQCWPRSMVQYGITRPLSLSGKIGYILTGFQWLDKTIHTMLNKDCNKDFSYAIWIFLTVWVSWRAHIRFSKVKEVTCRAFFPNMGFLKYGFWGIVYKEFYL